MPSSTSAPTNERTFNVQQILVALMLITAGVTLRMAFRDLPNFAPVAALALFAGYYFRSFALALLVPLSVMLISDRFMGGYGWQLMIVVYAMLALPVVARSILRRNVNVQTTGLSNTIRSSATVLGSCFAASVLFFTVTNLAVWQFTSLYEPTMSGLTSCFASALPFFRYTLAGDLVFGSALFAGYAMATRMASVKDANAATA